MPKTMTVGLLYALGHQTEEEDHLNNGPTISFVVLPYLFPEMADASPAFLRFLELMGKKITLEGHSGYRGDLDVSGKNLTGTHAYYHKDPRYDLEMMYWAVQISALIAGSMSRLWFRPKWTKKDNK